LNTVAGILFLVFFELYYVNKNFTHLGLLIITFFIIKNTLASSVRCCAEDVMLVALRLFLKKIALPEWEGPF
jgi:hypothetical protein